MAILDVCMIAKDGVHPPDDILDALRVDTGDVKTVVEPYYQVFPNPTGVTLTGVTYDDENHQAVFALAAGGTVRRNLTADHWLTRDIAAHPVMSDDAEPRLINYRLRMAQNVERPVVVGGWKVITGSKVGDWKLYRVRGNPLDLLRLHEWMAGDFKNEAAHPAAGAIAVQDTDEVDTMEPDGVYTRLNKNPTWWAARKQAISVPCESITEGSGAAILSAANEPQLLLGWLKAAQPQMTQAALIDLFWKHW